MYMVGRSRQCLRRPPHLRPSFLRLNGINRPILVYRFPRRALTLCPQLCIGIQPDARFPARSADILPTTLYGHFTQAIYRNRPIDVASIICPALGRGVTRSKRRALQWFRKAADNGFPKPCMRLAARMYADIPYAREVGHVGEAVGFATPAGIMEGHDVPPDVLTGVVHWLQKWCATGQLNVVDELDRFRRDALEGGLHCFNAGCAVVGQLKNFKVCPQCKHARRRVPKHRLDCGWPQGNLWQNHD